MLTRVKNELLYRVRRLRGCGPRVIHPVATFPGADASCICVVAHPDDEILWLSSVLSEHSRVVACFAEEVADEGLGKARRRAMSQLPYAVSVCLGLTEPGLYETVNWRRTGMDERSLPEMAVDASALQHAYRALMQRLREHVAGVEHVFTHNPWGEYGHEEHVLVYAALRALKSEFGYQLWYSNYCADRNSSYAARFMGNGISVGAVARETNAALYRRCQRVYMDAGCWTWCDPWPLYETEYLLPDSLVFDENAGFGRAFPLNFIRFHPPDKPDA